MSRFHQIPAFPMVSARFQTSDSASRREAPSRGSRLLVTAIVGGIALLGPIFASAHADDPRAAAGTSAPAAGNQVPKGLSAGEWSDIRATYEAGRHAAFACEGGYAVHNPGQRWRTRFDGRGFVTTPDSGGWSWGLALVSYGPADAEETVCAPSCAEASRGRVSYAWADALTEWFVNDRRGLEHGYTIHRRPEAATDAGIRLTLEVRGDLQPQVSTDGRSVQFVNGAGTPVVNYSGLMVIDADGEPVPAWFEPVAEGLRLTIDDAGARYPLTVDPIAQQAYLKASNTGQDRFGWSIAVSGDTVVVGAIYEDSNATGVNGNQADNSAADSGAAYVFVRNGGIWSQQAYLKASNTGASDNFGHSVAVSGDTVVIGAIRESSSATGVNGNEADNGAFASGAAYVFVRSGGVWSQQAYLKASNTGVVDQFGSSVAVSGDTVVVGAPTEQSSATGVNGNQADNSANSAGAAYVFARNGTTWSQQAYLKASNTAAQDLFGLSVGVSADTVVVGARYEDSSATGVNGNQADNSAVNSGAAYVFARNGTTWSQQAYLKASNTGAGDWFGISVAVSGDTVVVGADEEDSSSTGVNGNQADNSAGASGAAYVFVRDAGGAWSQQAYLKASNTGASDLFGWAVAASGETVVVGAYFEDSGATGVNGNQADNSVGDSGAAYVFIRGGGVWSQQAYLKASNTGWFDKFGWSVAASGDTVVVGAYGEASNATGVNGDQSNNSTPESGAAYVFTGVGPPCVPCDVNCDGSVNPFDIQPFLDQLNPTPPAPCSPCAGDADANGTVNPFDINAFVACMNG